MTIEDEGANAPQELSQPQPREPAIRAPWPAVVLAGGFLALYALQGLVGGEGAVARYGFSPLDLQQGRLTGLVTALFVHGSWGHVFFNSAWGFAFGVPVARLFGKAPAGVAAFFVFFLICGALSSLGYAACNWGAPYMLVGASGAVSAFMGATSRLMEGGPQLSGFTRRPVLVMAAAYVVVNLILATGGRDGIAGGAPIAWQAHLAGYAAGLFLIGPFARALRRI